jgi:hypothetical protein
MSSYFKIVLYCIRHVWITNRRNTSAMLSNIVNLKACEKKERNKVIITDLIKTSADLLSVRIKNIVWVF